MKKIISTRKFKNMLKDSQGLAPEFINFHDIRVNGELRGCSGFLRYENGKYIYVNTEPSCYGPLADKILYRLAKHEKDYCGEENHWHKPDFRFKHDSGMKRAFLLLVYGKDLDTLCN